MNFDPHFANRTRREQVDGRSMRRLVRLGFLSPRILEAMVEGRQPPELSLVALTRRIKLQPQWSRQEQVLGFPDSNSIHSPGSASFEGSIISSMWTTRNRARIGFGGFL